MSRSKQSQVGNVSWIAILILTLCTNLCQAQNSPIQVDVGNGSAAIVFLKGKVFVKTAKDEKEHLLKKSDHVNAGDQVRIGSDGRIALKLPDQSFIRFAENTTFVLKSAEVQTDLRQRNVDVNLIMGKSWATVSKMFGNKGRFEITTRTAVAGVRGTVFRTNANSDQSTVVKVYDGEVTVKNASEKFHALAPETVGKPLPVKGPQPVDGPSPVTMEQWTYIVKAYQQIIIQPDGSATKPFRFAAQADQNEWVKWNQQQDLEVKP